jgi:hypothetical protein
VYLVVFLVFAVRIPVLISGLLAAIHQHGLLVPFGLSATKIFHVQCWILTGIINKSPKLFNRRQLLGLFAVEFKTFAIVGRGPPIALDSVVNLLPDKPSTRILDRIIGVFFNPNNARSLIVGIK